MYFIKKDKDSRITNFLSNLSINFKTPIFGVTIMIIVISMIGISQS